MRGALAAALVLLGCNAGTTGGNCNDVTQPPPLTGQRLGDPCSTGGDCTAGLVCGVLYLGGTVTQQSACTIDCTTAACPADSACVDGQEVLPTDGGSRRTRFCAPMCATDGDCEDAKCPAPGSLAPFSPGWCRKLPQ